MKMQFSSVVLTFFLVCNIFVIKSEVVSTEANATRSDNVDLIGKNETVSSTIASTELNRNVSTEVSTTTAVESTTKQPDPSHLLIPPATDKAQIHNANVTTKKPSRFQAAV
jgi:hypothetical protein